MAITITRGLSSLVSVFNQQSIEFTVPKNTAGVAVTVGGFAFTPVRTSTVMVDTYVMDLSEILKYVIGLPNGTTLSASCTITISETTTPSTATTTGRLCYGYDQIGAIDTLLNYTYQYGARGAIYHNGFITFFLKEASGTYTGVMNSHSANFALVTGYNTIATPTQWNVADVLVFTGTGIELNLVYRASDSYEIKWLDEDGRLSRWNFRRLSGTNESKRSNSIPRYYATHALTTEKSIDLTTDKSLLIALDTVAVNDTHYEQLCKIQDSLFVQLQGVRVKVRASDSTTADCRQNLHFTITLEQEQYAPTY